MVDPLWGRGSIKYKVDMFMEALKSKAQWESGSTSKKSFNQWGAKTEKKARFGPRLCWVE